MLADQDAKSDSWPHRPPPPANHDPFRLCWLKSFSSLSRGSVQGEKKEHGHDQNITRLSSTLPRSSG